MGGYVTGLFQKLANVFAPRDGNENDHGNGAISDDIVWQVFGHLSKEQGTVRKLVETLRSLDLVIYDNRNLDSKYYKLADHDVFIELYDLVRPWREELRREINGAIENQIDTGDPKKILQALEDLRQCVPSMGCEKRARKKLQRLLKRPR